MCLLTALIVKMINFLNGMFLKVCFFPPGIYIIFLEKTFYTKHERPEIPNLDLSEKIQKLFIK